MDRMRSSGTQLSVDTAVTSCRTTAPACFLSSAGVATASQRKPNTRLLTPTAPCEYANSNSYCSSTSGIGVSCAGVRGAQALTYCACRARAVAALIEKIMVFSTLWFSASSTPGTRREERRRGACV